MRRMSTSPSICTSQISGRKLPTPPDKKNTEENFRPGLVGEVCRVIWPGKTDFTVADITGKSDRSARDWMSGKVPLPSELLTAINVALTRRPKQ